MQLGFRDEYNNRAGDGEYAHSDECPIKYGKGNHLERGYALEGEPCIINAPCRWKNAYAIICVAEAPPRIVKVWVQETPFSDDDCYNYYAKKQNPPEWAPNLGGPPLVELLAQGDTKFFFHDLLGRGGRSKNPQKGHFHPDIPRVFAALGIREIKLTPQGHFFSPQEELNRNIQDACAKQREIFGDDRQDYGPQNYKEVQIAVSHVLGEIRKEVDGDTKERRWVKSAYKKRGDCTYYDMMHAKLHGRYLAAWNTVNERRAATNDRYVVRWDPMDGRPDLMVECLNGSCDSFKEVTDREKRKAKRAAKTTATAAEDASIYVRHGLTSNRVSNIPTPDVNDPKTFEGWVFRDDEGDEEVEFGVIQDIHKEVGMDCVFYKRVRTRVARNEDFIALNEFMGYFQSGSDGKKGMELAKQIFRESQ